MTLRVVKQMKKDKLNTYRILLIISLTILIMGCFMCRGISRSSTAVLVVFVSLIILSFSSSGIFLILYILESVSQEKIKAENEKLKTTNRIIELMQDNSKVNEYIQKFLKKYGYIPEAELLADSQILEHCNSTFLKNDNIIKTLCKLIESVDFEWINEIKNNEFDVNAYPDDLSNDDFYGEFDIFNKECFVSLLNVIKLNNSLRQQGIINDDEIDSKIFYSLFAIMNLNQLTNEIEIYKKAYGSLDNLDEIIINNRNDNNIYDYVAKILYLGGTFDSNSEQTFTFSHYWIAAEEYINKCIEKHKNKKFLDSLDSDDDNEEKITINDIDLMSGNEFEYFVADLFTKMGYKTHVTKASNDQGIDVIAENSEIKVAIQAKCYSGIVGNHAIMEAVGGMKYYKANKCMVVTNRNFTKSAIELARANNVELWNRKTLEEKIHEYM